MPQVGDVVGTWVGSVVGVPVATEQVWHLCVMVRGGEGRGGGWGRVAKVVSAIIFRVDVRGAAMGAAGRRIG